MGHKGLIAWAVLGLSALIFQATLFFKDNLAAHHPQWRPVLVYFCKWAGCQIMPLQVADAVLIDHAAIDLISEPDSKAVDTTEFDAFPVSLAQWRFQLTLRNAQNFSVAMPWIELTLTDLQDQPVMRKVLNPVDFGAPKVLKAGEIWSQDLRLRLANEQIGFLGYRLLTFYP
jgi:hypothetical protein